MDDTYLNPLTPILEGGNRVFPLRSGENEFGASRRKKGDVPIFLKNYEIHFNGHLLHVGNCLGTTLSDPLFLY